jgi:hypothetical protein
MHVRSQFRRSLVMYKSFLTIFSFTLASGLSGAFAQTQRGSIYGGFGRLDFFLTEVS